MNLHSIQFIIKRTFTHYYDSYWGLGINYIFNIYPDGDTSYLVLFLFLISEEMIKAISLNNVNRSISTNILTLLCPFGRFARQEHYIAELKEEK